MQVSVNGATTDVEDTTTVAAVVSSLDDGGRSEDRRGVAVALNSEVVPRSAWATTPLRAGDSLEVLTPTAGG